MNLKILLLSTLCLFVHQPVFGQLEQRVDTVPTDTLSAPSSVSHWGYTVYAGKAKALAADEYVKRWLKKKKAYSVGVEVHYQPLPQDSDLFARDYGYPTLTGGLRLSLNHGVTMHRDPDTSWDLLQTVDYTSHLGNTLSAYFEFERPFWRNRYIELEGRFGAGVGFSTSKYNKTDAIDNEFIGAHVLIYFGAGLQLTVHPVPEIGVGLGVQFYHHSNGALSRPNKGSNIFGPQLNLSYTPYYETLIKERRNDLPASALRGRGYRKGFYMDYKIGVGAKTLEEEWSQTQFHTDPSAPEYRTDQFTSYMALSAQADLMYRYARRWASGIGIDAFYGFYADRVRAYDREMGNHARVSPFSLGIAAKHSFFYHNVSLDVALGGYLYRHMGTRAKNVEKWYYERVGVTWHIPSLAGMTIGGNVKAHLGKADFTELTIGVPIML